MTCANILDISNTHHVCRPQLGSCELTKPTCCDSIAYEWLMSDQSTNNQAPSFRPFLSIICKQFRILNISLSDLILFGYFPTIKKRHATGQFCIGYNSYCISTSSIFPATIVLLIFHFCLVLHIRTTVHYLCATLHSNRREKTFFFGGGKWKNGVNR